MYELINESPHTPLRNWRIHIYQCALEHEAQIYKLRLHQQQLSHMRQHIKSAAPRYLLDEDTPLADTLLATFNKKRCYSDKLAFLQEHLPPEHPLKLAEYNPQQPQLEHVAHRTIHNIHIAVRNQDALASYGTDDPLNHVIHTDTTQPQTITFVAVLFLLKKHTSADLKFTLENKLAAQLLKNIAERYLRHLLQKPQHAILKEIAILCEQRLAEDHNTEFHEAQAPLIIPKPETKHTAPRKNPRR